LDTTGERFDGRGVRKMQGAQLPFAARVSDVAHVLELFWWTGGIDLARTVLLQRRGKTLDPTLVDAAIADLPSLIDGLDAASVWDEYLAAEPGPLRISGDDVDRGCIALGRFGDLKSLYTLSHS